MLRCNEKMYVCVLKIMSLSCQFYQVCLNVHMRLKLSVTVVLHCFVFNHAYARQCTTLCQKPFAQYMEYGKFDPSVNRKRLKILRSRLRYIITLRSRVVVKKRKLVNPFWPGKWGKCQFFFLQTHNQTNRQSIKQFFRLVYISQIQKYVKHLQFKTRRLTHRCAFWGLQHLNLIFPHIFSKKYVKIIAKIGNFKLNRRNMIVEVYQKV